MTISNKKLCMFLIGCMGARVALTVLAYKLPVEKLPIMGYFYIALGFGFILNFIFKIRKSGIETEGEKIWWDNLRPVHAFLYLWFAYLAVNKNKHAWKVLLFDTIIGLVSFVVHYS